MFHISHGDCRLYRSATEKDEFCNLNDSRFINFLMWHYKFCRPAASLPPAVHCMQCFPLFSEPLLLTPATATSSIPLLRSKKKFSFFFLIFPLWFQFLKLKIDLVQFGNLSLKKKKKKKIRTPFKISCFFYVFFAS